MGQAWSENFGPTVRPGQAWVGIFCIGLFFSLARPGPARENAQVYSALLINGTESGDSYAPQAGAPLFAPPAGGGSWAAAHQCSFLVFFFCFIIISKGFLALFFTDSLDLCFPAFFKVLLGDFQTFKI
jgi:hypothetical protein